MDRNIQNLFDIAILIFKIKKLTTPIDV